MHAVILITLSIALALGGAALMIAIERRAAACPRPGDATVTAAVTVVDRPSDGQTGVTVTLANPGPVPVLVGMTLCRQLMPAGWRPSQPCLSRRTGGCGFRPPATTAATGSPS